MRRQLLVLLAIAALSLPWLGAAPLFDDDEGAFSEATREMFASGDFLSTTLNGAPRFDKPILVYWLQALSVALFGLDEFALRLPSALATLGWCYAVLAFALPRLGAAAAQQAAWIAATSLGVLIVGRAATADALLNALLAAALFDAWRHFETGHRGPLRRAFAWIALGVLAKGPIAIIVPLAVSLLWCASSGRLRDGWRAVFDPGGLALLVAIAAPWYAYALAVHGTAFVDGFILKHNVERFSGTLEGHSGSILYYVIAVPLLLLPWTGLLPGLLRRLRTDWAEPAHRFLWIWFLFVLVFFSASGTKLPHYALYGATPLFVLLAVRSSAAGGAAVGTALVLAVPTLLLALLPWLPAITETLALRDTDPRAAYHVAMALRAREVATPAYYAVTVGAAALWAIVVAVAVVRGRAGADATRAVGAGLFALAIAAAVAPWAGALLAAPVRDAARVARERPEPVVRWNVYLPSFSLYMRRVVPAREPAPGELALTRIDRLPAGPEYEVLFREGGLVLVRRAPAPQPR